MTPLDLFFKICLAGFSIILLTMSLLAFNRHRSSRLAFVAGAFALYSVISVAVLLSSFLNFPLLDMNTPLVVLNIGVLLLLYFALIKR